MLLLSMPSFTLPSASPNTICVGGRGHTISVLGSTQAVHKHHSYALRIQLLRCLVSGLFQAKLMCAGAHVRYATSQTSRRSGKPNENGKPASDGCMHAATCSLLHKCFLCLIMAQQVRCCSPRCDALLAMPGMSQRCSAQTCCISTFCLSSPRPTCGRKGAAALIDTRSQVLQGIIACVSHCAIAI